MTSFSFQDLNDHELWDTTRNNLLYQFLQGFVPVSLSARIHEIVMSRQRTNDIIKSLHTSMIKAVFLRIWLERCKDMHLFEQSHSIDEASKQRPNTMIHNKFNKLSTPAQEEDENLNDLHMTWIQ